MGLAAWFGSYTLVAVLFFARGVGKGDDWLMGKGEGHDDLFILVQ